jgi:hypothetical protein
VSGLIGVEHLAGPLSNRLARRSVFRTVVRDAHLVGECEPRWYKRVENNGWRPVSFRNTWAKGDLEAAEREAKSSAGTSPFHYSVHKRQEEVLIARKLRKRRWMAKLYSRGQGVELEWDEHHQGEKCIEEDWDRDRERQILQWLQLLDYDEYIRSWQALGTSAWSGRATTLDYDLPGDDGSRQIA